MKNKELDIMSPNHRKTKRNYISRMMNSKVNCMIEAKKYGTGVKM